MADGNFHCLHEFSYLSYIRKPFYLHTWSRYLHAELQLTSKLCLFVFVCVLCDCLCACLCV